MAGEAPYRKVAALIVRDRAMLLITATAAPDTYTMPGGPTDEAILADHLDAELAVETVSLTLFGRYDVVSGIDGARVLSTIYRAEIAGEPRTVQPGRNILWATSLDDIKVSTTVAAVWADAAAAGLVGGGHDGH